MKSVYVYNTVSREGAYWKNATSAAKFYGLSETDARDVARNPRRIQTNGFILARSEDEFFDKLHRFENDESPYTRKMDGEMIEFMYGPAIRSRYYKGETFMALAKEYGLSYYMTRNLVVNYRK